MKPAHTPLAQACLQRLNIRASLGVSLAFPLGVALSMANVASAQVTTTTTTTTYNIDQAQRLTDWLRAHPTVLPSSYPLAMAWTTPEETKAQTLAQQALLHQLNQSLVNPSKHALLQWLQSQAPTGRVALPAVSIEWLEANPVRNPNLQPGDTLVATENTAVTKGQVTLLNNKGHGCRMAHQPGAYPADYLKACALTANFADQHVWVIQPNGRTQYLSLAPWQPETQTQLAPNAMVWTGLTQADVTSKVSPSELQAMNAAIATFLSKRTDGLASLTATWPAASTKPLVLAEPPSYELTGISQARFDPSPSASNWGVVGLMQTPTARMRPAGTMSFTYQRTWPYANGSVMFQPLDWLEAGFRYTDIANRLYGPDIAGNQSYKDKSFELKAHLWPESDYLPSLAAGVRDLAGTGLFGGEYVVANKRWGRLDFSAGMGWGYVGGRQNLSNPLSVISKKFDERQSDTGQGGTISTKAFFSGPASVFGGVEYQTPWGAVLKAEYDGNNYQHEPQGNNQVQKSALNFGVAYRIAPGVEMSVSRERGNTWGIGFTFFSDWSKLNQPKLSDKPTPAVALGRPQAAPVWQQTRQDIDEQTQWDVVQIKQEGNKLVLDVANAIAPYHSPRVNKAMAVVHRDAPANIDQVELRLLAMSDVMVVDTLDRQAWVASMTEPARTDSKAPVAVSSYPQAHSLPAPPNAYQLEATTAPHALALKVPETFSVTPGLSFNHILGGPDAFLLYQLSASLSAQAVLPGNVNVFGALNAGLISNYDKFKYTAPSNLPRVRTYLREFATESKLTLPSLYVAKAERLSTNWSAAAYGGFLESMYAGVGGEVLYRQPGSRWAAGLDLNQVQQRDFAQHFALRDYKAKTGNLSLYWQTPWQDINMAVSAGQYLAGDKGASMSLTKVFNNGVTMGAFATKTNVSAAQFGEGSFNKGVYWSIPFDAFMTRSSRTTAVFNWIPLTRDGGAMLNRPVQLIGGTHLLDPRVQTQRPASRPQELLIPDDLDK